MKTSKDDVQHYASLSKIKISDQQAELLAGEMTQIQDYISKLDEVDVSMVEPTAQVSGLENVHRKDELIDYGVSVDELLKNSTSHDERGIKVPKVL